MQDIKKYAKLLTKVGVNVQPGQPIVINAQVDAADLVRELTEEAYALGAKEVHVNWADDFITRQKFEKGSDEIFDIFPQWQVDKLNSYVDDGAAVISITSSDPDMMNGVDLDRLTRYQRVASQSVEYYRNHMMSNKNAWCVAAYPSIAWAKKVFPNMSDQDAFNALWDAIKAASRADVADPVAAWRDHQAKLAMRLEKLNSAQYDYLLYENSAGTNVKVKLPKNHIWLGGKEPLVGKDYSFAANIPTEEVFTSALYDGVDGKIVSTKPLSYGGSVIDKFWFEFKNGRVEAFGAEQGYDVLEQLMNMDEGARHLGEVALVPHDSPISNTGILFYNTLFDENASSHFAVGRAYPSNIEGGSDMSKEELAQNGMNESITHVDFMVGSADLTVTAYKADGSQEVIIKDGNFTF